ncbi:MAG: 50S ribosomal protein L29 [Chloroflexi bacterium]|nr:50S ribosomal protein L29 [Chloroflexota bacterium]MDA1218014.1 50S ribosomal protein L29 [Chloroflexota bacterium]PKB57320.1 MAG: 50S ribosomal protein L29 [SAR202 cluster bacterium Casp-Chloro-G3]
MQIHEIRDLSNQQLQEELESSYKELMGLRFRAATNQLTDTNQPKRTRRSIARLLTVIQERGQVEN